MKMHECEEVVKKCSEKFKTDNAIHDGMPMGMTSDYDVVLQKEDGSTIYFDGILLGTFISKNGDDFLQFPYHLENPAIPDKDREMYLTLKAFGEKIGMIELTQVNLGFNPFEVVMTHAKRRLPEKEVHIGPSGLVESAHVLDEILAVAAMFHKSKIVIPIVGQGFTCYIAITDDLAKPYRG
jgi:hypothetical protein